MLCIFIKIIHSLVLRFKNPNIIIEMGKQNKP
jgi:hypothetical protein